MLAEQINDGAAAGDAQDLSGYDDPADYRGHVSYICTEDGEGVLCLDLFVGDYPQCKFATERELWNNYPAGTKFIRSSGGSYEVIDGVMRELYYPPSEMSPELQAAIESVLADLSADLAG